MSPSRTESATWHPRRWGVVLLALGILSILSFRAWAAHVKILLPDRSTSIAVVTIAQREYVDARAVAALLEGRLRIDSAGGRGALRVGSNTLAFQLSSAEIRIAQQTVPLAYSPRLQGRRFLLPVEALPVLLSARYGQGAVDWKPQQRVARVRPREATITRIRVGTYPTHTRVVLETAYSLEWSIQRENEGGRLRVWVPGGVLASDIHPLALQMGLVRTVQPAQHPGGAEVRLISEGRSLGVRAFALKGPDRIVIDVLVPPPAEQHRAAARGGGTAQPRSTPDFAPAQQGGPSGPPVEVRTAPVAPADGAERNRAGHPASSYPPDAAESTRPSPPPGSGNGGPHPGISETLTVVLDPGHGGHDTGAVGPTGLMEKEVVLDLALRLRRLLQERLGVRVIMTRTEDVFVPLQERTAIANRARADFFLSLHVNGSAKRGAVGFETFYFTREPSDNDARGSAQRENLVIEADGSRGKDQESLLRITLADMAVTRDMRESSELAELVLASLDKLLKVENRGVKSGPFYVLATAAMPAILIEGAFITNPKEERKLQRETYRQRVAEALYEGIAKYKARYERRAGTRDGASPAAES